MTNLGIMSHWKKIVFGVLILVLCLGFTGAGELAKGFTFFPDKGLNPIPNSPPPPSDRRLNSTKTYSSGNDQYDPIVPGLNAVSPNNPNIWSGTVPARISEYATSVNYMTQNGNFQSSSISNGFKVGFVTQNNTSTNSLLMYPQVRDIIPPVATIDNAILITSSWGANISFQLSAYEITSSWDPRNFSGPLPTFSVAPVATGVYNVSSTTMTNRTLDVTATVNNWFSGTNSQWGFMVKTNTPGLLQTTNPPRLYISYTMPNGSFQTAQMSGGTWYDDGVCPGMWISRRATYIYKNGILGDNVVKTYITSGSMTYIPPLGQDNQSMRWVVPGKTFNPEISGQSWKFDVTGLSYATFRKMLKYMPPVDEQPFMKAAPPNPPDPIIWPLPPVKVLPVYIDHGSINPFPPTWPDGDLPPTNPLLLLNVATECVPYEDNDEDEGTGSHNIDPDNIDPHIIDELGDQLGGGDKEVLPPLRLPLSTARKNTSSGGKNWPLPADGSSTNCSSPPARYSAPTNSTRTYTWQNGNAQYVTFKNSSTAQSLSALDTNSSGWSTNFNMIRNSIQLRPNGNISVAIGDTSVATTMMPPANHHTYPPPTPQPEPGPIYPRPTPPAPPPAPTPGETEPPVDPNDPVIIVVEEEYHNREQYMFLTPIPDNITLASVLDDSCNDNTSLEAYDTKLPYPEFTQSENVGVGNAESPIQKMLSFGAGYTPNLLSGGMEQSNTDFSIPCHGSVSLEFARTYSSKIAKMGITNATISSGWTTNLDESVTFIQDGYIAYHSQTGETYIFTPNRGVLGEIIGYASPPQLDSRIITSGSGDNMTVQIQTNDGLYTKSFDQHGKIIAISSAFGGSIQYIRNLNGLVTELKDSYSNRSLLFTYDTYNRLTSVEAPESRNWTYTYDTNGNLSVCTNPIGGTWSYIYNSNHMMTKVTDPRNNDTNFSYNNSDKLIQTTDALSPSGGETITYDETNRAVNIMQPSGSDITALFSELGQLDSLVDNNGRWVEFDYDHEHICEISKMYNQLGVPVSSNLYNEAGQCLKQYDAYGNYTEYTYNTYGKIASYKDREGKTTYLTWNNDGTLVQSVVDPLGRTTIFNFDLSKNLTSIISPYKTSDPRSISYTYNTNGYVNQSTNQLGKNTSFFYNNCGEMISTTNALGKTTTFTYNKMGWLTKVVGPSPDNFEIGYTYDANGNVTEIKNPRGFSTQFEYNSKNLKTKAINALNQNTYYIYDESGKLLKTKDHFNKEVSIEYDNCSRVINLTDQDGKVTEILYNTIGEVSGYKNNQGQRTETISYDHLYRPIQVESAEGSTTQYEYDKEGHVKKVTDPLGRITNIAYDDCYQVTSVTDNLSNVASIEYWPSGQVKKTTDPLGHYSQFDYNKLGALTSTTDYQSHTSTVEYNDMGWATKATDPLSNYVTTEYNIYGLPTKTTNQLGKYNTYEYDANGNCTKQTTSLGREYTWTYDELDRVKRTITPLGYIYENTYNEVGNLVETKDPLANLEKYEYNDDYSIKKYIDQINNETAYDYNDSKQVSKVTTPKGTYQQYTYDKDGQLKTVTDPLSNVTTYNYDLAGQLTSRVMPRVGGGTSNYTYTYDNLGRRTSFTDEVNKTTSVAYNAIGLTTQVTHPNSKTISSTYDSLNRLTGISFGGGESFSFGYDALSRNTTATDAHGTKTVTFDSASRVTAVEDAFGEDTTLAYDDDNRSTSMTTSHGTISYNYDNDSRPTTVTLPNSDQITNTYDNAARLTHSDLPNTVDLDYAYNNANMVTQKEYSIPAPLLNNYNRITAAPQKTKTSTFEDIGRFVQYTMPTYREGMTIKEFLDLSVRNYYLNKDKINNIRVNTPIATFSYDYDANRNITGRVYPAGSTTYIFDNYDRLTEADAPEGTYTYTYDIRNNRSTMRFVNSGSTVDQTTTYTYTYDDRLTSYSVYDNINLVTIRSVAYTYDDAGDTLSKAVTEGGITQTTYYTYYDDNRIKTVTLPDTTLITYTYYADGSRATKTNATEYIKYHYSGGLVKEVHYDKNNLNTVLFTVHYEPTRMIIDNGSTQTVYYPVTDTQGTVYKLLNAAGSVVASYNYDPFGTIIQNTAPTIYMPLGFGATYYDAETGLNFAQQRYYDTTTGRFTTKDSFRGDAGSPISQNRYIYCSQNPISSADPSGFAPMEGEHASDSTPTQQKTSAKEDVEPVESKPNMVEPSDVEKEGSPLDLTPGEAYKDKKTGATYVNIGGWIYKVTFDANGKCTVDDYGYNNGKGNKGRVQVTDGNGNPKKSQGAKGMEDAFNAGGSTLKDAFLNDPYGFAKDISWLMGYTRTGRGPAGSIGSDYRADIYSAVLGWGIMKELMKDKGFVSLFAGEKGALANWKKAVGKAFLNQYPADDVNYNSEDLTVEQFFMILGFQAAYANSSYKDGHISLDHGLNFKTEGVLSLSSVGDLVSIAKIEGLIWFVTSGAGTIFDPTTSRDDANAWKKVVKDALSAIGLAACMAGNLLLGLIQTLIDKFWKTDRSGHAIDNSSGINVDMYNLLMEKNGGGYLSWWNLQNMWGSIGTCAAYLGCCLDQISAQQGNITMGDISCAAGLYLQDSGQLNWSDVAVTVRDMAGQLIGKSVSRDEWGDYGEKRYAGIQTPLAKKNKPKP